MHIGIKYEYRPDYTERGQKFPIMQIEFFFFLFFIGSRFIRAYQLFLFKQKLIKKIESFEANR